MKDIKIKPYEAAKKFVEGNFPECDAALLAGSVARGKRPAPLISILSLLIENCPKHTGNQKWHLAGQ